MSNKETNILYIENEKRNMFSNLVFEFSIGKTDYIQGVHVSYQTFFENWKDKFRDFYLWYGV